MNLISLDHAAFRDLDRVRIKRMVVRLIGLQSDYEHPIQVEIVNLGVHYDRLGDKIYTFVIPSRSLKCRYYHDKNGKIWEIAKAQICDERDKNYVMPTPFTRWKLKVSKEIELKDLQAIYIGFYGESIL